MTANKMQLMVFTDLDGTLLDHHSYSYEPALPMLERLQAAGVPVVFCTSKTRAEVEHLRKHIGNHSPFIVENGAAVFIPAEQLSATPQGARLVNDYWVRDFCPPRQHWLTLIEEVKPQFGGLFEHFAAMGDARVAELTGLNLVEAGRARAREYGEPLRWLGTDEELTAFSEWFGSRGARVLRGGRFVHLAGESDKGQALRWLTEQWRQREPDMPVVSIAAGDSHNDVAMLEAADYAVVVRSPVQEPPVLRGAGNSVVSHKCGPEGWSEGVEHWLRHLGISQ
ncbi:HAD-IIB family hydrolase [Pseudomaricurvus alkylphenolicus]|jgi:mannosyl-3-phosphoglycerate phosphatase family protein|uniref:HAD-IIB family hydrolase n=1 Tax=Pseudomaricurvus alkylphenolicus TaxID=1306991 RepID=UPI001420789C|nr:HAD-IIB family hydrolase [Pseudomaricurvus alkylphenolicus]NIB39968.1 HAD-IIB family hydrolase [Pseudomaricurvus alkylphenolicus]